MSGFVYVIEGAGIYKIGSRHADGSGIQVSGAAHSC